MDMWIDVNIAITIPVNLLPLIDDADFKTRETGIVYNQAGMDLVWNFQTTDGVTTQTAVTPTTAGDYDWTHSGDGMYKIEIPTSGDSDKVVNDIEGFGWFTGICDGVLAWRGPVIGFRSAALNNALVDGGDVLDINVTEISGDSAAADNLELDYDGTGYNKTNSTVGACTTNTDMRGTDNAALASGLSTHDGKLDTVNAVVDGIQADLSNGIDGLGALKTLIDAVQVDLDDPDQYKADITALALEATLTAIKGAGFDTLTDSLKKIKAVL